MNAKRALTAGLLAVAAVTTSLVGAPSSEALSTTAATPPGCKFKPLIVEATPVAVQDGSCTGVRPGAIAHTWRGKCTMNFLFTGSDGQRYAGTAGHCVLEVGEAKRFADPKVYDQSGNHIGDAVYAVTHGYDDPGPIIDFALIRLNAFGKSIATPEMCHFGGPVAIDRVQGAGEVIHHYGNGSVIREALPGRTGVTFDSGFLAGEHTFAYTGDIGAGGDSGSPVIDNDGNALGVLVAGVDLANTKPYYPFHGGTPNIVTHLDYHLARAERAMGVDLTIETAPAAKLAG